MSVNGSVLLYIRLRRLGFNMRAVRRVNWRLVALRISVGAPLGALTVAAIPAAPDLNPGMAVLACVWIALGMALSEREISRL